MLQRPDGRPLRVTILVQNLPVPLDRRVWCEAGALRDAGARVSVVAPNDGCQPAREVVEGIEVRRYPPPPQAERAASYAWEYGYSWAWTLRHCLGLLRRPGIDVLHGCNPPDIFWSIALLLRPFGVRYVYDQHDLCPELLAVKYSHGGGKVLAALLRWLERRNYRRAAAVLATNDSYAEVARQRGGVDPERVTVVRSAPPRERFRPGPPDPAWRGSWRHLVGYIGVMGSQDGVDLLVRAARHVVRERGRSDVGFLLIGGGDELPRLRDLAAELGVAEGVCFTGRMHDLEVINAALGAMDVGVCPDPPNPFNSVSSMNKVVEYMALAKPVVSFDLAETRATVGPGGVVATPTTPEALGEAILALLDDPERRAEMGRRNRERFLAALAWEHQAPALVAAYRRLLASIGRR